MEESAKFRDAQLVRTIDQMQQALEGRATTLARSLSMSGSDAVAGFDYSKLTVIASELVDNDAEILYCLFYNSKMDMLIIYGQEGLPEPLDSTKKRLSKLDTMFPVISAEGTPHPVFFHRLSKMTEVTAPVYNGNILWGKVSYGYSLDVLQNDINALKREWIQKMKQFRTYLITITTLFLALAVVVVILITRSITHSITLLNKGVRRIADGDLEHTILIPKYSCSEFYSLSNAFNIMTAKLRESYRQLRDYNWLLEEKVVERTKELEKAQAKLINQAHEAGMAEMAVGVLHNIGNALTPAKVGLSLLVERLKESPLRTRLSDTLQPMEAMFKQDTALSDDEKARFGKIIAFLPAGISEEFDFAIDEINKVKDKQEHVEDIIRLQMRYANLLGNFETVDLNQLVRDTLQMLEDSLHKRKVVVACDLREIPVIRGERSKIIQIFMNVIKNAYESMDDLEPEKQRLEVSTSFHKGTNQVVFRVRDHGCGFNSEDQDRLFTFGYSSKKRGSGFGLHSCANYLIANKGSIEAHSDGVDQGAEFIIRLPVGDRQQRQSLPAKTVI